MDSLVALDSLLAFSIGLVGMVKGNFKLIDVRFKLFLDTESLSLGTLFSFKGSTQVVHGTLVVLASVIKLFLLLLDTAVNLLTDLSKLKLSPKNLVLLLLQCCFSFLQGSLKFLLLNLQATTLLVQLMDGPTTITQLVKKILDLISQVLVLPLDNIKLLNNLIMSSLEPVELTVVVAAFLLACFHFSRDIISLGLPFSNNLVKVLASLLSDDGSSMSSLIVHGELLKIRLHTSTRLLTVGNLDIKGLYILFSLLNTGLQLVARHLQLINSAHTFSLKARAPQLDLGLGLRKSFQCIRFALMFIFNTLTSILQFSAEVLEFAQQSRTVTAFRLSHALGIFKLGGQRNLALVKTSHGIFTLLNLPM